MHLVSSLLTGNWAAFRDTAQHLILPALALATIPMALIARMTRPPAGSLGVGLHPHHRTPRA